MRKFTTTVKLTKIQAEKLIKSFSADVTSFSLDQLFTLPIGTEVIREIDYSEKIPVVVISFDGSSARTTIRIPENKYFFDDIVDGFLYAKNFAGFKLHVWHFSAHIIGKSIRVNDETIAQCGCCGNPQYTKYMVKRNMDTPISNANTCNENLYEYWCDGCGQDF